MTNKLIIFMCLSCPGTFKLTLQFTEDYPNKPPTVRFVSRMFHPNSKLVARTSPIFQYYEWLISKNDSSNLDENCTQIPESADMLSMCVLPIWLVSHIWSFVGVYPHEQVGVAYMLCLPVEWSGICVRFICCCILVCYLGEALSL